jgi:hypothetical protein
MFCLINPDSEGLLYFDQAKSFTKFPSSCCSKLYGHVGFVVVKVAFGEVFSQYFSFPYHFSFRQPIALHYQQFSVTMEIASLNNKQSNRLCFCP